MPWVYILQCHNSTLYTGSTTDLERRIAEHQRGEVAGYTAIRLPVKLVFSHYTNRLDEAFHLERQIKGWRRAKKLALIHGDYEALVNLSRSPRRKAADPPKGQPGTPVPERCTEPVEVLVEGRCSRPTKSCQPRNRTPHDQP